jgi:hypothetical protein
MSHANQDPGIVKSTHAYQVAGKTTTVTPVGNNDALEIRGDFAVWDTVANKFVNVDQTLFGTTIAPKLQ